MTGREKNIFSIYNKMHEKHISFSEVNDIFGFRIVVPDVPSCYLALGALHPLYKPVPGRFKDYIAIPKANGYQSLHTTLFGPFGTPIEFQIRTEEMHAVAEAGIASHWMYKSTEDDADGRAAEDAPVAAVADRHPERDAATRASSSSTSRSTCSPTRSTSSRPRARSSRCRAAPRRSTSPTRSTPTSATTASRPRSTASRCRCAPS